MRHFFIALTRNPISLLGAAVTTTAAVLILILLSLEIFGHEGSPYIGILAYLILPGFLLLGLLLIPIGIALERRRARRATERGESEPRFPIIDMNLDRTRSRLLVFLSLTLINVVILATATYKGVEVMESTEFCGTACHVMQPEFAAYNRSSHSRVKCVECHIGPGANWFVKSKLSGAWQVISATFDLYEKPIPTPVHNLRPARDTCEQCHWANKLVGDKLKVITHYAADEANTELQTVLVMRVGGSEGTVSKGIHWHVDPTNTIRYRADPTRENIYEVELARPDGSIKRYLSPEDAEADAGEWRVMDCVDCHNRPTHVFLTPEQEVDQALRLGKISTSLPYVRREAVRALKASYVSHDDARTGVATSLASFYAENYSDSDPSKIDQAARVLGEIYSTNVFPDMNVGWGSYPNHIGHENYTGCFRCHTDEHETEDGETISQDCFTCHSLLAMEEEDPEILESLMP